MEDYLSQKLEERRSRGNLRELPRDEEGIDLCSNDYLGMARSAKLHKLIADRLSSQKLNSGSTGSRLLTGNSRAHEELEKRLAKYFNGESALLFSSGYSANMAVVSSLTERNDIIFFDELSHASLRDGLRLSFATSTRFRHNDLNHLRSLLEGAQASANKWILVESVYSMDGDICDLEGLAELADEFGAWIIVDEAHSTGIYGRNGNGMVNELGLSDRIAVRVYTFGKAPGIHGACVVGSETLKQYLVNFARSFIYTTGTSPHELITVGCALDALEAADQERADLMRIVGLFRNKVGSMSEEIKVKFLNSSSPIQGLIIPGNLECREVAKSLRQKGLHVLPVLSPSVPEGSERIRICLHSFNTDGDIEMLFSELEKIL